MAVRRARRLPAPGVGAASRARPDRSRAIGVGDLPEGLLDRVLSRVADEEAPPLGAIVFGSYASGDATPASDLDLHVLLDAEPRIGYRTWFLDGLPVSIGVGTVSELLAARLRPAPWAFGFPVEMPAAWVLANDEVRAVLGDPPDIARPAADPELEDFVEWCGKGLRTRDPLERRVAARGLGEEAPALLLDLNGAPRITSRVEAVRAACAFQVAPDRWSDDLLVLLGLAPAEDERVLAAVERLGRGVLRVLRERGSRVGDGQPELTRYLHDGTLERHLGFA